MSVGSGCYIGRYSYLDGDIVIGDNTMLASFVAIVGGDHIFNDPNVLMAKSGREHWKQTRVGSNCWIGHGAIIMNGVSIGDGSVVAAGAIVLQDVEPGVIVAGSPARVVRARISSK